MTLKFDNYITKILENASVASVLGNDGAYDASDARVPKVIGPMLRRKRIRYKKTLRESGHDDSVPTKPGSYLLLRGSHDGNERESIGIYANGVHYTTDYRTAAEFGEPKWYKVVLKNPIVLSTLELYKLGNPTKITADLIRQGYDSVVIPHEKEWEYFQDGEERVEKYTEYEVIKLKNI